MVNAWSPEMTDNVTPFCEVFFEPSRVHGTRATCTGERTEVLLRVIIRLKSFTVDEDEILKLSTERERLSLAGL